MNRFEALIRPSTSIREAIELMASGLRNKFIAGLAVVVDDGGVVTGVVSDGDIRRGLARGVTIDDPVAAIANTRPVVIDRTLTPRQVRQEVARLARQNGAHYLKYSKLILVEPDGRFFDVILLSDILVPQVEEKTVAVYGMGFVGLTLACTFAKSGLSVIGIDTNTAVVEQLRQGRPTFYEKGLDSLMMSLAGSNPILFTTDPAEASADIHVVSVGTPLGPDKRPDLTAINAVCGTLAGLLKKDDLVVFRSTLPVGTMRRLILPMLERSGLVGGVDFHLAFAPERTIEGKALEELRTLPQIIGGLNRASTEQTATLFRKIANTIVEVPSLEAAEMIKLMNNTFRDLVFSFANEVATLCDGINVNAFELIQAANEGYPRNPIPLPSPGVGGLCLAKDPYLYSHPVVPLPTAPTLGIASRAINSAGPEYVLSKLYKFCEISGRELKDLKILIIGLAFKGVPETSDIRDSVALKLVEALPNRANIRIKDFVVPDEVIAALGCTPVADLVEGFQGADAVLVMNNHYLNSRFNLRAALNGGKRPVLFFDGWNLFDQREVENINDTYYATMGYMTPPRYYKIARLTRDRSIFPAPDRLTVDLAHADGVNMVCDDEAFLNGQGPDSFFWASGGGTLLLNGRYLLLVQRSERARVNPGKYSLFTGRADTMKELLNPRLLVRELFEEIVLSSGDTLLWPQHAEFQEVIDAAYADLAKAGIIDPAARRAPLELREEELPTRAVRILTPDGPVDHRLCYHVNGRNDINVLFLLGATVDLASLTAADGEYHVSNGKVVRANRRIAFYDLQTGRVSAPGEAEGSGEVIGAKQMTEHLSALIAAIAPAPVA